ncbi:hypothetical protein ANCCEY_09153 [Ancylostoma ceylanicum]|nr:hypothetical protein ANCCEY_09153 [Ancylostoma ceylanicum]
MMAVTNEIIPKGRVLVDITDGDLEEIGIGSYDERQDLLLEIRKEKLYSDLDELSKLKAQNLRE